VDIHRTEEEQIEAIKHFFSKHGLNVLLGFALFLAMFFGYQWWESQQKNNAEAASSYYNQMRELVGEEALSAEQKSKFDEIYGKVVAEFPKSIYASYASLLKAKVDVSTDDLDKAAVALQWVVDTQASDEVVRLASLRLARVLFAKNENENALKLLDGKAEPFSAAYEELRGDIYLDMKQNDKALQAYQAAKSFKSDDENGQINSRMLDMKINSLNIANNPKVFDRASAVKATDKGEVK